MKRTTDERWAERLEAQSPFVRFAVVRADGRIVVPNDRFLAFIGYSRDDLGANGLVLNDLIEAESRPVFASAVPEPDEAEGLPVVQFRCRDGAVREAELTIRLDTLDDEPVLLCHGRPLQEAAGGAGGRRRNIEIARANIRLYEMTERVSSTYDLSASLLHAKSLDELTRKACAVLTDKQGLNAEAVAFVIREGDRFRVKTSGGRRISRGVLAECEEAFGPLASEEALLDAARGVLILPLISRGAIQGVLRVQVDPATSPVFAAAHEVIRSGALDIFKTLANMISILIDNLHLYQDLEMQSIVDPLTGAYNRRFFDRKARREVKRAKRYGEPLSFLLVDIDEMKEINDQHGHLSGDRILTAVTELLKKHCREEDAVCRYGGDEFLVILVETGLSGALQKGESLRELIASTPFLLPIRPQQTLSISISCGVASLDDKIKDEHQLFRAVDKALYRAKQAKNTVCK